MYLCLTIGYQLRRVSRWWGLLITHSMLGWSRSPKPGRCRRTPCPQQSLLTLCFLLLSLYVHCPPPYKIVFDWARNFNRKYRGRVSRPWNWFLPCFEKLIQLSTYLSIDQTIRFHEGLVKPLTKDPSIWAADVLYHRIKDEQGGKLAVCGSLLERKYTATP